MARRKRRTYQETIDASVVEAEQDVVLEWNTAIYARLSIENSNQDDDGESIQGQVDLCRTYVDEHPYLHLAGTYVDNGWTGTNMKRPEFEKMLNDINSGRIKAVVVKDFSRFSRDYIEAGNLLENIFPFLNVRFISVVDHYDSFQTDGSSQSLLIPLKNLINSFYSKDISKKVSTAIHTRQIAGEYLSGMIPYGYRKSKTEEHRMEPDPETAPNVTRLFEMRGSGMSYGKIAAQFNEEGIPSPGKLRYLRGQTKQKSLNHSTWTQAGLKAIFKNPCYLGRMVSGRTKQALFLGQSHCLYQQDSNSWIIHENTHEPLVSQELFNKVAEINKKTKDFWQEKQNAVKEKREANQPFFHGNLYCGDCNSYMSYHRYTTRIQGDSGGYTCNNYSRCIGLHHISQERLKKIVWGVLQEQLSELSDYKTLIDMLKNSRIDTEREKTLKEEKQRALLKLNAKKRKREQLYEDFCDRIISAEEYQIMKQQYDAEYQKLSTEYHTLRQKESALKRSLSEANLWLQNMETVKMSGVLTREVLEAMVEKILIYETGEKRRVEVCLKYQEDLQVLQRAYKEVFGDDEV